jgi:hypothetical protein
MEGAMRDEVRLKETAVFMIHAIKRMLYAFQRVEDVTLVADQGSPAVAFYLDGIYSYVAAFFLLDNGKRGRQGSFQAALEPFGLTSLLDPAHKILEEPFGNKTFGEVIRSFRNKVLVHSGYQDADIERAYAQTNMLDAEVQADFQRRLELLRDACARLALDLARSAGINPADLGLTLE